MKTTLSAHEAHHAATSVDRLDPPHASSFALVEKVLLLSIGVYFTGPMLSLVG
jgi:hypothetical protein